MSVPESTTHQVAQSTTGSRRSTTTALVGFYVGMVLMIAAPSAFVATAGAISSQTQLASSAPLLLLLFAVPLVLVVVPRTRRFGRYVLLGMVSTALVVGVVGGGVLWVLISTS